MRPPHYAGNYPVELSPPDLDPYKNGHDGPGYVMSYDSGRPGPHAMLVALVHGNEICGAIALDRLLRAGTRPDRGRLTFTFANVAAYKQFDARYPEATRYIDEDFNRLWLPDKLGGAGSSIELHRARELRPIVDSVDILLDLHSMQYRSAPLALAGSHTKGLQLARAVGAPSVIVIDAGHASGTRLRDYGDFGDPASSKNALLVECGQHWAADSAAIALTICHRFLAHTGTIDRDRLPAEALVDAPPQRVIEITDRVTVQTDDFRFTRPFVGLEKISEAHAVIGHDGPDPIRTPYADAILVMPSRRLVVGQTAVRIGREIADAEGRLG